MKTCFQIAEFYVASNSYKIIPCTYKKWAEVDYKGSWRYYKWSRGLVTDLSVASIEER